MPENPPKPSEPFKIQLERTVADRLKAAFPSLTYQEAIVALLDRFESAVGDPANCATTELWIKLDRLEEMLGLTALTNVQIADDYRRQVGGELAIMRNVSAELGAVIVRHQEKHDNK